MIRVLELFAGIGGVAEALRDRSDLGIVAAVDHDEAAHRAYTANFAHPALRLNLASVRPRRLAALEADAWWMSPPCQPFTVRGRRRDVDDPRCAALLNLIGALGELRPRWLGLENVPGFAGSVAHTRLVAALRAHGYRIAEAELCPTALGIPNERRRFYLVADREAEPPALAELLPDAPALRPLADFLEPDPDPGLYVPAPIVERYADGLAVTGPDGVAHCFTAAYGRSWVYSGSYLREGDRVRRFSPREILRLLGFRDGWILPDAPLVKQLKLVGNSLSVAVVERILAGAWVR